MAKKTKGIVPVTLNEIDCNKNWTDEEMEHRNMLLLLVCHLSTLQMNIAKCLEQMYKKKGWLTFEIKHNHSKILKLMKENTSNDFFKRMNNDCGLAFSDDAEHLERVVYSWAGIEHPSNRKGELSAINLNLAAKQAYECAETRGKFVSSIMQLEKIKEELRELCCASLNRSIHINYTEQQEEAADVIISTLTLLHGQGVDINKLIEDKMEYNARRKD